MKSGLGGATEAIERLVAMRRPFRARDLARRGVEPRWLDHLFLPRLVRLERGVYGDAATQFSRVAVALVRINRSFACLTSALWLHGLLAEEPAEAFVCIHHKAWKPRPMPDTPIRLMRTSLWPQPVDLRCTAEGLPFTGVARTIIDLFRYRRFVPPRAGANALSQAIDSGKCQYEDLDACAARYGLRWEVEDD